MVKRSKVDFASRKKTFPCMPEGPTNNAHQKKTLPRKATGPFKEFERGGSWERPRAGFREKGKSKQKQKKFFGWGGKKRTAHAQKGGRYQGGGAKTLSFSAGGKFCSKLAKGAGKKRNVRSRKDKPSGEQPAILEGFLRKKLTRRQTKKKGGLP